MLEVNMKRVKYNNGWKVYTFPLETHTYSAVYQRIKMILVPYDWPSSKNLRLCLQQQFIGMKIVCKSNIFQISTLLSIKIVFLLLNTIKIELYFNYNIS